MNLHSCQLRLLRESSGIEKGMTPILCNQKAEPIPRFALRCRLQWKASAQPVSKHCQKPSASVTSKDHSPLLSSTCPRKMPKQIHSTFNTFRWSSPLKWWPPGFFHKAVHHGTAGTAVATQLHLLRSQGRPKAPSTVGLNLVHWSE